MTANEGLNIKDFRNGRTVEEIANQYGIKTDIVEKILTPEGERALGMYDRGIITLAKSLKESTAPHELLHAAFDMVDSSKRQSILKGIEKKLNVDSVAAEEWLADSFSEYYRTGTFGTQNLAKTFVEKIKQFFYKVKKFIDGTYQNEKQIQKLFDDIIAGNDLGSNTNNSAVFQNAGDIYSNSFKNWFGDWENGEGSKVVDGNGNPLVVYHGGQNYHTEFNKDYVGSNFGQDSQGFFFTDSEQSAKEYADNTSYGLPRENPGVVMDVYLNIRNPLVERTDYDPVNLWDNNYERLLKKANANGNDGIIIKADEGESMYVAFEPNQIKSASDNVGTYDPNNPDIRYQTMPDYDLRKWKSKGLKEIGEGKYGKIYTGLKGNQAVAFLLGMQDGEMKGAFNVRGNPIDLTRSGPKIGVKKLLNKHPEALWRVQEMIDERLNSKRNHPQEGTKYVLEDEEGKVVFNIDWDGKGEKMFITAYKFKP